MRLFSALDRTFGSYRRYLIRNAQKPGFISDLNTPKTELSYLNWISHLDNTAYFRKDELKKDLSLTDFSPLSLFIDNYKKKVESLDSRIKEIESLYRSESDHPCQLEYEPVGSHAYYLRDHGGSVWLFRSKLPSLNKLESEDEPVDNTLSTGHPLLNFSELENQGIANLRKVRISPEEEVIALLYDPELRDKCEVAFYLVPEGRILDCKLEDVSEVHFMPCIKNKDFIRVYYTNMNEGKRSHRLMKILINKKRGFASKRRLVYEDPEQFISMVKSKSGDSLFVASTSYNRVYSAFMIDVRGKMYVIPTPKKGKLFSERRGAAVYLVNSNTVSEIVKIPVYSLKTHRATVRSGKKGDGTNYVQSLKERENGNTTKINYTVTDIDMFEKGLVLYLQKAPSSPRLAILNFGFNKNQKNKGGDEEQKPGNLVFAEMPVKVGVLEPGSNLNYRSERVKMSVSSPGQSLVKLELDLNEKKIRQTGRVERDIKSFILEVPSKDGSCKIPVTVVVKSGDISEVREIRGRKCLVYVYGFYGENLRVCNHLEHKRLLEMGYVLCFAHVRGGRELGEEWQKMGNKENKHNSFYDLVDVMKWLIARNITSRERMALSVSSASGILGGCVYNMNPELCSVIIFKLPYLDLLATMRDEKEPLVEMEYEEFGKGSLNFWEKEAMERIYSLDPCNNVKNDERKKPVLIINTDKRDVRAPWYHTAKFVSQLREEEQKERVFVKMSNHGHEGSPPYEEVIRTVSEEISIIDCYLSMNKNKVEKYVNFKR